MACDKQQSFGSLLEQLIVAPYAMRIDLGKRVLERVEAQVAELTRERDDARAETAATLADLKTTEESVDELKAEVVRLLYELKVEQALQQQDCIDYRDGVRAAQLAQRAAEAEVTRLTEALAAAERGRARAITMHDVEQARANSAESEIARLTRERAGARVIAEQADAYRDAVEAEVVSLKRELERLRWLTGER